MLERTHRVRIQAFCRRQAAAALMRRTFCLRQKKMRRITEAASPPEYSRTGHQKRTVIRKDGCSFLIPYAGVNPSGSNTSILPPSGGSRIDAAYLLPVTKENAQDHGGGIAAEVFPYGGRYHALENSLRADTF